MLSSHHLLRLFIASLDVFSSASITVSSFSLSEAATGNLHFLFREFTDACTLLHWIRFFSFFLVCLFVRFFAGFQLRVVRFPRLILRTFFLVLFLVGVEFAVEFPEDIGYACSGCDDFVPFSSRSFGMSVFFLADLMFEMLLIPLNSSKICCIFSCLSLLFFCP